LNSAPMIDRCFRHQHPEAYGGAEVPEPQVPVGLRHGSDPLPAASSIHSMEEDIGLRDVRPLESGAGAVRHEPTTR
jgi:hypothetical protein